MRLSACYIVKDETDELARSLRSVALAADEIIVVLTADSEATAKVAAESGASLYRFPWQNDFSLARNFALSKATGDWLICLDADEYFLHPEAVRGAIMEIIAANQDADAIFIVRKEIYSADSEEGMGSQLMARIFRNDKRLRYQGCIHEMMVWEDGHPLNFAYADCRLTINHTGYEPGRMEDKTRRNLELLENDAARNGKGLFHSFYLADCYYALGKYEQALQEALTVLQSDFVAVGFNGKCYHMAIECMRKLNLSLPGMLALSELAIMRLPDLPDFYGERGMILCALGRLEEARVTFVKAVELYESKAAERSQESSFFSSQAAARVYHRLGEITLILDDDETAAAAYFAKAMKEDASLADVRRDYEKYCQHEKLISACYIVRNEAKNLAESLKSIASQVDEIIVVDTGSTDETISVAQAFGANVFTIKWQDDFSVARNTALAKAAGKWILFLDADEYFSPETAGKLRSFVQSQQAANLLMIYMRNIDCQTGESLLDFYAPRLFRRLDGIRYIGRIHEQLRLNESLLEPVLVVAPSNLTLIHTGYSPELSRIKAERNLKLLLAEIAVSKTPELFYMYLAETYDGLNQPDKAMHYARLDIESGKKNVSYASRSYKILLRLLADRPACHQERLEIARRACTDFPDLPEFRADLAECLAYELDFAAAVAEAEKAIKFFHDYHGIEPCMFTIEAVERLRHRQEVWQAVIKRMAEIKISACLIATNEEKDLPGYLANASAVAHEIIVVDGGSTDNSLAILKEADANIQIIFRPWNQDFAAARNTALQHANGDWALVMDSDERILDVDKVKPLLAFWDVTCPKMDALMATIINIDEDDDNRELYRFPYTRFVRLGRGLSYEGRIHEQLTKARGILNLQQEDYRLQILHTGYSAKRMQKKLQRNLVLLQNEIAEQGEQPRHYRYLAEIYFGLGNPSAALKYALADLESGEKTIGTSADMYYLAWQCMRLDEYPAQYQYEFMEKAAGQYPHLPEFWGILGVIAYDGQDSKAYELLHKAIGLWEKPKEELKASASSFGNLADEVYRRLADLEALQGNHEEAWQFWRKGFSINKHNENLLNLFCKWQLAAGKNTMDLAEEILSFYAEPDRELTYLARFAENYGYGVLFEYFLNKQGKQRPSIYDGVGANEREDFFEKNLLPAMVKNMQDIPMVLVNLEQNSDIVSVQLLKKCAKLLPREMYNWWLVYYEKADIPYNQEITAKFQSAFTLWGSQEQLVKFEQMKKK